MVMVDELAWISREIAEVRATRVALLRTGRVNGKPTLAGMA